MKKHLAIVLMLLGASGAKADGIVNPGAQYFGDMNGLGSTGGASNVGTPPAIFDGVANVTLALSMSRKLLSSYGGVFYTATAGAIDVWKNQTAAGATNDLVATTTARPTATTGGLNNVAAAGFDGVNDYIHHATLPISSLITASTGWVIACVLPNTITVNNPNIYDNVPVFGDAGGFMGMYLKNVGTPKSVSSFNFDTNIDVAASTTITAGTAYVFEWIHSVGTLSLIVNNGTPVTSASGNTGTVSGVFGVGHGYTGSAVFLDGLIFEVAAASVVPANHDVIASNFMGQCGARPVVAGCVGAADFSDGCAVAVFGH